MIQYQTRQDRKGKIKAVEVSLVNDSPSAAKPSRRKTAKPQSTGNRNKMRLPVLLPFAALLSGAILFGRLPVEVAYVYLLGSLIALVMYAIDKSAARKNRWRTPESQLHLIALVGGWPGAYLAQQWLRHKSAKRDFKAMFWFTVLLNLVGLGYLLTESGHKLLAGLIG